MRHLFFFASFFVLMFALCGCCCTHAESPAEPTTESAPASIADVRDFLRKTGHYFLATVDGDQPRVRPFGTVLLYEGKLYIQTGKKKNVSKQIAKNGKVELCAFDGACWLRLSGTLVNDDRREVKAAMLEAYPELRKMYNPDDENTQVLYFKDATAVFNYFGRPSVTVKF